MPAFAVFSSIAAPLSAQVYSVGGSSPSAPAPSAPAKGKGRQPAAAAPAPAADSGQLGFGSNIENARLAHAAEQALERGDHHAAADFAYQAATKSPGDAHLWFLLGYAARLDGRGALSADSYARGLRLSPDSLEGLSGLAQTYSVLGRTAEAEKLLKQVIATDPRRTGEAVLLGDLLMRGANYDDAIDTLSRAERAAPNSRAELLLAICYQRTHRLDEASHYLNLARSRAPGNPEVERALAGYYREVGQFPAAIEALRSIHDPAPDVVAELAYTYQLSGDPVQAATLYAQAADSLPRDLGLQLATAQAEMGVGALDRAHTYLDRGARLQPENYRVHAIRGELFRAEDHPAEAVAEYKAALARMPEGPVEGPLYPIQLHLDLFQLESGLRDQAAAAEQLAAARTGIDALGEGHPQFEGGARAGFLRLRASVRLSAGELSPALADVDAALAINAKEFATLQLQGDILMRMERPVDAISSYGKILAQDAKNKYALISLGYAERAAGRNGDAQHTFEQLAAAYPNFYVPFLALGDLHTAERQFPEAQTAYARAFELAPGNPLVVTGALNAAVEAHNLDLAGTWLARATPAAEAEPTFLREKERYLSFRGDYAGSAEVGQRALAALPNDRDVIVYLGYDLLHLERYDELLQLVGSSMNKLPHEPDLPLLAGYVHKSRAEREQALADFTEALRRDPEVVTAYVNRGYVWNDLRRAREAAADFQQALRREPGNGEAHLGLAYAYLDLRRPKAAVHEADLALAGLGDSEYIHLIRATAYGRMGLLARSAGEYRAALRFAPNDPALHLGLAGTLYGGRHYREALAELAIADTDGPGNPFVHALMARCYAAEGDHAATLREVALAEQAADARAAATPAGAESAARARELLLAGITSEKSAVDLATGEALNQLGDRPAAMVQFRKALLAPGSDRVAVRLDMAGLEAQHPGAELATRQVALAMMEAEAGETAPPTGVEYAQAAGVFSTLHEYALAQTYLDRAEQAGAPDTEVRVAMANNYLALGDTPRARAELDRVPPAVVGEDPDVQFLLAQASLLQQEHRGAEAMTSFAQASNASGDDPTAQQSLLAAGADEGLRYSPRVSLLSDFAVEPIFEDTTVYVLDAKLDSGFPVSADQTTLLPPPRSSIQTELTGAYHLHPDRMPTVSGFLQVRNARGEISVPSTNTVVNRDTTDWTASVGLAPTLRFGTNSITFDSGVQGTIRRDTESPVALNQNLFRVFTYVSTSSFFHLISASGYALRETGPFTESNISSRNWTAAVDFRVGAPWGHTALITGWGANDQQFNPNTFENYYTSSYIGLERKFSARFQARAMVEDLRAWRTFNGNSGIAQDLRPAGSLRWSPGEHWDVDLASAWSSTRSFHVYDATQNQVAVSYVRPLRRHFQDSTGDVTLAYPIRFAAGVQTESFYNFPGTHAEQIRPYFSITLF